MSSTPKIAYVYFADGTVSRKEFAYIACKLQDLDPEDHDFSRMTLYRDGEWYRQDLEWDVVSVCSQRSEKEGITVCALSAQGDVLITANTGITTEKIKGAGTREGAGAVRQIRYVDGSLYVCGTNGQVYARRSSGWVQIGKDLRHPDWDLNSIDGLSEKDIYVVGQRGRIFHYDGTQWTEVKSPTKSHLERVRCVSSEEVYACGHKGALLRGNFRDGFKVLSSKGENFWGLEVFMGKVYLAGNRLFVFDGEAVVSLITGLEPEVDGYRLDAKDGEMWSFGVDDLARFDGKTWTRVVHPDSPPR
jgi:hypothetical protein